MECRDNQGWSPLYHAVYENKEDVIEVLLELGADVDIRAYDGKRPLFWVNVLSREGKRIRDMLLESIPSRDSFLESIRDMFLRAEATGDNAEAVVSVSESERGGNADEDQCEGRSTYMEFTEGDSSDGGSSDGDPHEGESGEGGSSEGEADEEHRNAGEPREESVEEDGSEDDSNEGDLYA